MDPDTDGWTSKLIEKFDRLDNMGDEAPPQVVQDLFLVQVDRLSVGKEEIQIINGVSCPRLSVIFGQLKRSATQIILPMMRARTSNSVLTFIRVSVMREIPS